MDLSSAWCAQWGFLVPGAPGCKLLCLRRKTRKSAEQEQNNISNTDNVHFWQYRTLFFHVFERQICVTVCRSAKWVLAVTRAKILVVFNKLCGWLWPFVLREACKYCNVRLVSLHTSANEVQIMLGEWMPFDKYVVRNEVCLRQALQFCGLLGLLITYGYSL